jgi:hypothetical protein
MIRTAQGKIILKQVMVQFELKNYAEGVRDFSPGLECSDNPGYRKKNESNPERVRHVRH